MLAHRSASRCPRAPRARSTTSSFASVPSRLICQGVVARAGVPAPCCPVSSSPGLNDQARTPQKGDEYGRRKVRVGGRVRPLQPRKQLCRRGAQRSARAQAVLRGAPPERELDQPPGLRAHLHSDLGAPKRADGAVGGAGEPGLQPQPPERDPLDLRPGLGRGLDILRAHRWRHRPLHRGGDPAAPGNVHRGPEQPGLRVNLQGGLLQPGHRPGQLDPDRRSHCGAVRALPVHRGHPGDARDDDR